MTVFFRSSFNNTAVVPKLHRSPLFLPFATVTISAGTGKTADSFTAVGRSSFAVDFARWGRGS